ncbi:MAG: TetR family transcriptional regulator [Rhizobiales bacterium]|nr:TetR family transcriptional regulator [Hyphomicrobiales bacterium]
MQTTKNETITSENKLSRRETRRSAMLAAANTLFIEKGYGATSLTDVVKESGGSLATLYDLFGGKEGLFQEVVETQCRKFAQVLHEEKVSDNSLDVALRKIGEHFFHAILAEEGLSFFRLVVSEIRQFPEIGASFYAAGPNAVDTILADYLANQTRRGRLNVVDPMEAARTFISLVIGQFQTMQLCGLPIKMTEQQIKNHLDRSVERFITIFGA